MSFPQEPEYAEGAHCPITYRPGRAQLRTLVAVAAAWERDGLPPSCAELAQIAQVSETRIYRQLDRLELRGLVAREPRRARSLRLTPLGRLYLEAARAQLARVA